MRSTRFTHFVIASEARQSIVRMTNAPRILEIGARGGYSTIWMARAAASGKIVTIEANTHHASVARSNIERGGIAERVELRVGPAKCRMAPAVGASSGNGEEGNLA